MIPDEAHSQRHARLLGVSHRGAHPRIGHRHDDLRGNRLLSREYAPELGTHFVDALAEHIAVGPREIHVLEDAVRERRGRIRFNRTYSALGDDDHFSRFDVTFVGRTDQIHRARFGTHDVRAVEPAERQRTESMRIADGNEPVLREHHERKRALHLRDGVDDGVLDAAGLRLRVQMQDDLRVAVRLEDRSLPDELLAQLFRVHEITVVTERNLPVRAVDEDRLRVGQLALTRRGIAHVADRARSREFPERAAVENVRDIAHVTRHPHTLAVRGGDAGAFLSPMLQRIQPEVGHVRGFVVTEDPEHAAFFSEFVEH